MASILKAGGVNFINPAGNSASTALPQPQVDAQLDSIAFSMEALESIVDVLMSRLQAVTGQLGEIASDPSPSPVLVPVAQRISYIENRVRAVEARLSFALRELQI